LASVHKHSCVFKNIKNEREFVVVLNFREWGKKKAVRELAQEVVRQISRCLKINSSAGLGAFCQGLGDVPRSYSQARFAVKEILLQGYGKVYDFEELQHEATTDILNEERKKLLHRYLWEGRKDSVIKLMEDLFDTVRNHRSVYHHLSIRELCVEFYTLLSSFLKQNNGNANEFFGEKFEFLESLMELESLDEVLSSLKKSCDLVLDYSLKDRKYTGEEIVLDVKNYIDAHYFEDISLSMISQKYFIHPNYFCRIFRNIVGKSFSDYITAVRMKKASELLMRSSLKLSRISELVGYEDPKYFSQVFKKYFGVTPSEYQSNLT